MHTLVSLITIIIYINKPLNQPPSVSVQAGEGLTITCQVSYAISNYWTHWIRQPARKGLECISRDKTVKESLKNKFSVNIDSSNSRVTLHGQNMQPEDTAVYYCAGERDTVIQTGYFELSILYFVFQVKYLTSNFFLFSFQLLMVRL
uniref:Ig-like domain-containing protein n=1 Tax=Poecilia latipinna TaxID=48699 RepID=A0A3B3URW3_9TELE